MLNNISKALRSYSTALGMISRHGLWSYFLLPGLFSLLAGGILFGGAWLYHEEIGLWMASIYPSSWPGAEGIAAFLGIVSVGIVVALSLFLFKYIALIISAPFLGPLSEKIESLATGQPAPKFNLKDMGTDTARAIRISLRNITREIFLTIIALILFNVLIPVVGTFLYPVASYLIQAFYAGFGAMDPALERRRYGVGQRVAFVRSHKGLAIGNGLVFVGLMLVPVLGWVIAPALSTAAATLDVVKSK